MNRLDLLKEIHDETKNKTKKECRGIKKKIIQKSEKKYELFYDEWNKDANKIKREKWHQFVRLGMDFQEIEYMFRRVNDLLRRYRHTTDEYFQAKFQSGISELPDRSSELEQLFIFSKEYFNIYKKIILNINFEQSKITSDGIINGKINWRNTIRKSNNTFPLLFETERWKRKFDTPENILLVWVSMWLNNQIKKLLNINYDIPLGYDEIIKLKEISNNCKKIIKYFPFYEIIEIINNNFKLEIKNNKIQYLELEFKNRLKNNQIDNDTYKKFLRWFNKIKTFNFPNIEKKDKIDKFLRNATKNIDSMYEIWIFFEMLHYSNKKWDAKLNLNFPLQFIQFTLNYQEIKIYYEKEFEQGDGFAWASDHNPDFTIMTDSEILGILDAKNYQYEDKESPTNKILAYITNLGTGYGAILWPKNNIKYDFPKDNNHSTKYHKNLKLEFHSLNLENIMHHPSNIECSFKKIFNEILSRLESAIQCPKCNKIAIGDTKIEEQFECEKMNQITKTQFWCKKCRNNTAQNKHR